MSVYDKNESLAKLKLGQATEYQSHYEPDLLQSVPRRLNRHELGVVDDQPFQGCDVWNAYELSWLNSKGKPIVALARCFVDARSPNIIESKSFKLYLNSFNQSRFDSEKRVHQILTKDLSHTAGGDVIVELISPDDNQAFQLEQLPGICIDNIDINIDEYELDSDLLCLDKSGKRVNEELHSHLLKSNCLITNQPDWASIVIHYDGLQIEHESLLRYLVSFRMHNEFHEQCVERIFMDIYRICSPAHLVVQALYTRRGGLDINPMRRLKRTENIDVQDVNKISNRRINRQ